MRKLGIPKEGWASRACAFRVAERELKRILRESDNQGDRCPRGSQLFMVDPFRVQEAMIFFGGQRDIADAQAAHVKKAGEEEQYYYPTDDELTVARQETNEKESRDLGWALAQLRAGHKVRRRGWNGSGMFLTIQRGYPHGIAINENTAKAFGKPVGEIMSFRPYVVISPPDGVIVPWVCSQTDLLGQDWELAQ